MERIFMALFGPHGFKAMVFGFFDHENRIRALERRPAAGWEEAVTMLEEKLNSYIEQDEELKAR